MPDFTIVLDPSTAQFYRRVAQSAGLCTEQDGKFDFTVQGG